MEAMIARWVDGDDLLDRQLVPTGTWTWGSGPGGGGRHLVPAASRAAGAAPGWRSPDRAGIFIRGVHGSFVGHGRFSPADGQSMRAHHEPIIPR
jgi:hypothetical protein